MIHDLSTNIKFIGKEFWVTYITCHFKTIYMYPYVSPCLFQFALSGENVEVILFYWFLNCTQPYFIIPSHYLNKTLCKMTYNCKITQYNTIHLHGIHSFVLSAKHTASYTLSYMNIVSYRFLYWLFSLKYKSCLSKHTLEKEIYRKSKMKVFIVQRLYLIATPNTHISYLKFTTEHNRK